MSLNIVSTLDDAMELKRWLSEQPWVAIDTETTGTDVYADKFRVRLLQFGSPDASWVVPMERWIGLADELITAFSRERTIVMHNCFSSETEFVTNEGIRTLGDACGETVKVLTRRQRWVDAEIKSFGEAPLLEVSLRGTGRNGRATKTVYATANHRWFVGPRKREVTTEDLQPGDALAHLLAKQSSRLTLSPYGVAAGIVHGDGTRYKGDSSKVVLYGPKMQLAEWFPRSTLNALAPTANGVEAVEVSNLPASFKDLPSLKESSSYLFGWLAGYFATDGSIGHSGQMTLSSRSLTSMQKVRDVCAVLGIGISPIHMSPLGMHTVTFQRETIPNTFFIRDDQASKFKKPDSRGCDRRWVVESVKRTDRVEEVFCAIVPVHEAFVLADGILTGNSRYDVAALKREGINVPWHAIDDTMIALRLAEPHKPAGLKPAATRHISAAAAQSQKALHDGMRKNGWDWATVPIDFEPYVYYAAMDTVLTARLYVNDTVQGGFDSPVYPLEMDVRTLCSRMEDRGMRIDRDFSRRKSADLREEAERLKQQAADEHGISLTSTHDLGRWLIENGAELTKTTPGGAPSVDKEVLEELSRTGPAEVRRVAAAALRVRKCDKLASSYFDNFQSMADSSDLLHPSIETVAARTGRMSIREPALQTLPRVSADPDSKLVRMSVVPRDEGEVLISCDYSQIELRQIASFSSDTGLMEAFYVADDGGEDFFTQATRAVYEDSSIVKSDDRRATVKSLFYASAYGAGVAKMAYTAGVTVDEMRKVHDRVFSRYPGLGMLMKHMERVCKEHDGWITTPAGRKVYVDPERAYAATNGLVQAAAADTMKQAIVRLGHAGLGDLMVVPVHDEMLVSCPKEDASEVNHILEMEMRDETYAVPLIAEPSDGYSTWGSIPK